MGMEGVKIVLYDGGEGLVLRGKPIVPLSTLNKGGVRERALYSSPTHLDLIISRCIYLVSPAHIPYHTPDHLHTKPISLGQNKNKNRPKILPPKFTYSYGFRSLLHTV